MTVDVHALAGAYALDALDDIERASFQRHLAGCPACAQEVAGLRETAARLADPTWQAPPPGLRAAVLAAAGRTRQVGPGRADHGRAAPPWWRGWIAGAAAAAVLATGAATATYLVQEQRLRDAGQVQAVLDAADAEVRRVQVAGGGEVSIVISRSRDQGVVLLAGLAAPDPEHAYQLWLIAGQAPASAGVLAAGRGSGLRLVDGVRAAETLAVTREPDGGSRQPTTDPLAALPLR